VERVFVLKNMPVRPELERLYDEHAQALFAFLLSFMLQQERLLAELAGPAEDKEPPRPRPAPPSPQSRRGDDCANA
jgi:hypothetical protein